MYTNLRILLERTFMHITSIWCRWYIDRRDRYVFSEFRVARGAAADTSDSVRLQVLARRGSHVRGATPPGSWPRLLLQLYSTHSSSSGRGGCLRRGNWTALVRHSQLSRRSDSLLVFLNTGLISNDVNLWPAFCCGWKIKSVTRVTPPNKLNLFSI